MISLQKTSSEKMVVNEHPFGKELYSLLRTDEAYEYLPDGDWTAGGCWLLAEALKRCCPALELKVLDSPEEEIPTGHVVVKLNTPEGHIFIDGDGMANEKELLHKMEFCDGLPNQVIGEYNLEALINADVAQVYNPAISVAGFARFLERELGPITEERIGFGLCDLVKIQPPTP